MSAAGVEPDTERRIFGRGAEHRRQVWSWWTWDLGSTALNSVMISFVFSVYVTGTVAANPERGALMLDAAQSFSGIALLLLAPLMGAWADRVRNRRLMLTVATLVVIACIALSWFVKPHDEYLLLGVSLLAIGAVAQDIGTVFYNGMLLQLSNKTNIGKISAIGWGFGYFGGIFCLVVVLFGFVLKGGIFGISTDELANIRAVALFAAGFMAIFSIPIFLWGPTAEPLPGRERFNVLSAYRDIGVRILHMWRDERGLLHFLIASAIFRDGLTAVFTFGGVIAASSYGFATDEVIVFGLAANGIALLGTWALSGLDDRIGPKRVIIMSLSIMVVAGIAVVSWQSKPSFWIFGLIISSQVGLVQSASRTLLARIVPPGEENETFGLYATVGRAATPIAPALMWLILSMFGLRWQILGIIVTILIGLLLMIPLQIKGVTYDRPAAAPR
ncbi:MAG: MFS transporter [Propionibacteriaceae bacterium]|nr:MFS transporter [Micropruina sp.]